MIPGSFMMCMTIQDCGQAALQAAGQPSDLLRETKTRMFAA